MMKGNEHKLAALDAAIERGIADAEAGRVHSAEEVFDDLRTRYKRMAEDRRNETRPFGRGEG